MKKGDRVRLSEAAKRANIHVHSRKFGGRIGTFVGLEKGLWVKVIWDGNKSVGSGYHLDFIELDTEAQQSAS